jgi:hypothetical protein
MVGNYNREAPPFDLTANDWPSFSSQRFKTDEDIRPYTRENPFDYSKPLPGIPYERPDPEPHQGPSKSFSSALLPDIRGLARRMSNSLRIGTSKSGKDGNRDRISQLSLPLDALPAQTPNKQEFGSKSKSSSWFRTPASLRHRHERPSLDMLKSTTPLPLKLTNTSPIPGHGSEPPVLPAHTSGSAARASAAAQNGMMGVAQVLISKADARASDNKLSRDSESGIGIDMRDRPDNNGEDSTAIVRRGKHLFFFGYVTRSNCYRSNGMLAS